MNIQLMQQEPNVSFEIIQNVTSVLQDTNSKIQHIHQELNVSSKNFNNVTSVPIPQDFKEDLKMHEAHVAKTAFKKVDSSYSKQPQTLTDAIHTVRHSHRGKLVADVPLFSLDVVSLEEQQWITGKSQVKNYEAGVTIVEEGKVGDCLYVVQHGCCRVFKKIDGHQTLVKSMVQGDFFGEIAIFCDVPRAATVIAETDVTLVIVSREIIFSTINAERLEKMRWVAQAQFLSGIALFQPLNVKQKVAVAEHLKLEVWHAGEVICRQGPEPISEEKQRVYIIEAGNLCVMKKHCLTDNDYMQCQTLGPGESYGMLGLIYGGPSDATVKAVNTCKTFSISYDVLVATCGKELLNKMQTVLHGLFIRKIPIFQRVGEDVIVELTKRLRVVHYKRDQAIFEKGEQAKSILILEKGSCIEYHSSIKDHSESREALGKEHNRPGTLFGVEGTFPFTLITISECTLLEIPGELVRVHPEEIPIELVRSLITVF